MAAPCGGACGGAYSGPKPAAGVRYKGRVYGSASAALEAYLEDFEPAGNAGKSRSRPSVGNGLDSFLPDLALDPFPSLCRSSDEHDPDSLSLTTEELLALPTHGSQLFLPPRPFRSRHPSAESQKTSSQTFSRFLERGFNPGCPKRPPGSKGRTKPLEEFSYTFPSRDYPKWFPSQQADFNASGRSSIPAFPYPTGLKTDNLYGDPIPNGSSQSRASSSQLLETGPPAARHSRFSFPTDSLHPREHPLLPLKATRESSSEDGAGVEKESSPPTTGILRVGKPWEAAPSDPNGCCEDVAPPPSFPKAGMMHQFLEDCLNASSGVSGGHPRPLEALKLLLFQLQAIQGSLSRRECAERKEELPGGEEPESQVFAHGRTPLTKSIRKALEQCLQCLEAPGGHQEGFHSSRR